MTASMQAGIIAARLCYRCALRRHLSLLHITRKSSRTYAKHAPSSKISSNARQQQQKPKFFSIADELAARTEPGRLYQCDGVKFAMGSYVMGTAMGVFAAWIFFDRFWELEYWHKMKRFLKSRVGKIEEKDPDTIVKVDEQLPIWAKIGYGATTALGAVLFVGYWWGPTRMITKISTVPKQILAEQRPAARELMVQIQARPVLPFLPKRNMGPVPLSAIWTADPALLTRSERSQDEIEPQDRIGRIIRSAGKIIPTFMSMFNAHKEDYALIRVDGYRGGWQVDRRDGWFWQVDGLNGTLLSRLVRDAARRNGR